MRIQRLHIEGFRAISSLEIDFDDLTAFVGTGGVGKSTILNALEWFFAGGDLAPRDLHMANGDGDAAEKVLIKLTFKDLTPGDRDVLGRYAPEGATTTTLTRTWDEQGGDKLSGNALVHPPFEAIRQMESGPREQRKSYVELCDGADDELGYPPAARSWDDTKAAMEQWEREHTDKTELQDTDARHLGGFTGGARLSSRFIYVLVSATAGAPDTLDSKRGSALERLLSAIEEISDEKREEIVQLQEDAQEKIEKVISDARGGQLLSLSKQLTDRIKEYFPGAAIKLADEVAPPRPPEISVRALVSDRGGHAIDPDLQGHGLQRAIVIALLHELAQAEPGTEGAADPPALMLAIEEPELYQHPLQARALAATLDALSKDAQRKIQVAYTTHSPYFTSPALFRDIRLCRRDRNGGTHAVSADSDAIEQAIEDAGYRGDISHKVRSALAQSLREAIFARAVILTEGPTDNAILTGIADGQGGLDGDGIAIADCGNKEKLGIAVAVLRQLGIPFIALFDADATGQKREEANRNRRVLSLCEEPVEDWPAQGVRERSANYADKLETYLESEWPEFEEARERAAADLKTTTEKDPRVYREAAASARNPPDLLVGVLAKARELAS